MANPPDRAHWEARRVNWESYLQNEGAEKLQQGGQVSRGYEPGEREWNAERDTYTAKDRRQMRQIPNYDTNQLRAIYGDENSHDHVRSMAYEELTRRGGGTEGLPPDPMRRRQV